MMKGGHGQTNQLYDTNWGAFNHTSHAPQLTSCNYCVCVAYRKVCMYTNAWLYIHTCSMLEQVVWYIHLYHGCNILTNQTALYRRCI